MEILINGFDIAKLVHPISITAVLFLTSFLFSARLLKKTAKLDIDNNESEYIASLIPTIIITTLTVAFGIAMLVYIFTLLNRMMGW